MGNEGDRYGMMITHSLRMGSSLGSKCSTMRVSPTRSLRRLAQLRTTHPAEHPALGGLVSSPEVQQAHPWMKKALLPHISAGFWGSRQKAQGRWVVSCMTFTQQPSLQVVAGRGPTLTTHCLAGLFRPSPEPEQAWVLTAYSPDPPTKRPVFWQQWQVMAPREGSEAQQLLVQESFPRFCLRCRTRSRKESVFSARSEDPRSKEWLRWASASRESSSSAIFMEIYYRLWCTSNAFKQKNPEDGRNAFLEGGMGL